MKKLISLLMILGLCAMSAGSVTDTSPTTTAACDGSNTTFTFDFPILATSDLVVVLRTVATGAESVLTETTDYSVSATNNDYLSGPGGTVTTESTYSSAYTLTILRDTPDTQATVLRDTGELRLSAMQEALDKATMLIQQLQEELDRCVKIPRSESLTTMLDDSVSRASMVVGCDSAGNMTMLDAVPEGSVSASAFMATVLDDADADAAKTTLEVPTITTAAATVLDDTTVGAMCTTLGAVQTTGNETIAGNKTFSGTVVLSSAGTFADATSLASTAAPTADAMIANKKYCDDAHEPYARMYVNSAQNNLTDTTWTTITLDTDTYDFSTITDLSNNKITPAVAGYYLVIGQVTYENVIAEKSYYAQIYKNGDTAMATRIQQNGAATTDVSVVVSDVLLLDSDDYVQLRGYVNCGAATVDINTGTTDTYLVLFRL